MQTYDDYSPVYSSSIDTIIEELEYGNVKVAIRMLKELQEQIESDAE